MTWLLLYYFLGALFFLPARARVGRARRGRAARRGRRSCSRPTWWRSARTGTAASWWTRRTCRSCCGSRRAGCARGSARRTSAGSRSPAASSSCAGTCRSASTPGWRSALYALVSRWPRSRASPAELPHGADRAPRRSARAAALAFGVAGFYNLPLQDYAQYSIRGGTDGSGGVGMAYATQWSMAPYELPAIVLPELRRLRRRARTGASMPFTDYPNAYIGIVTVLLALPALLAARRARACSRSCSACSRCWSRSAATSRCTASSTTTCRCSTSSASRSW